MPNSSSDEQVLLGLAEGHRAQALAAPRGTPRACGAPPPPPRPARARRTLVGELALGALDLGARAARAGRATRCSASAGSNASEGSTCTPPPGTGTRRRARRRRRAVGHQLEAGQPRELVARARRSRRPRAAPRIARRRLGAHLVAVAAQRGDRLDQAPDLAPRPPRRAASSSASGQSATASSPRSPGSSDQISSVTNGITGWSSRSVRSSAHSSTPDTARVVLLVEARLGELEVPVAELGPEGAVELERRVREAEAVEQLGRRAR